MNFLAKLSPMDVTIREHNAEDIEAITEVIKVAFAEHAGKLNPPSSAERKSPEVVSEELKTRKALVAISEGQLVGSVFYRLKNNSVYIDRLSVLPDFQGKGVATRLMRRIEAWARNKKADSLSLSVRLALTKQQAYYEYLGYAFQSFGTHDGFNEPTFMNMEKILT